MFNIWNNIISRLSKVSTQYECNNSTTMSYSVCSCCISASLQAFLTVSSSCPAKGLLLNSLSPQSRVKRRASSR